VPALLRAVRGGGVAPQLRPHAWPLLLGLFAPGDCKLARRVKWDAACNEYWRLNAMAANDAEAAAYYEQQVSH